MLYQYAWANQSSIVFSEAVEHIKVPSNPVCIVEIEAHTLDYYEYESVDFIKIDTEGAELSVIMGAIQTIENNFPTMIIECHVEGHYNSIADILRPLGYSTRKVLYAPDDSEAWEYDERYHWLVAVKV
jgi:hypothetical protein